MMHIFILSEANCRNVPDACLSGKQSILQGKKALIEEADLLVNVFSCMFDSKQYQYKCTANTLNFSIFLAAAVYHPVSTICQSGIFYE